MNRASDYSFDPFLERESADWYGDDPLLGVLVGRASVGGEGERVAEWGKVAAGRLRTLAEASALPEHAPRLRHRDAYGDRVDEVVLPASTGEALALALGHGGLGSVRGSAAAHYAMIYLLAQNGEAGIACALACTDGLARVLAALGNMDPHHRALAEIRSSTRDRYVHGAQFVTEKQGGSDVGANRVQAVRDGAAYRLLGQKWFCSNINADWFLVTARPERSEAAPDAVGLFLVPAYADDGGSRNGYTIDRLKDKLGTRELATAEVTFEGALGWPVGPLERGVPNLLRYVLTPSRLACVVFAAAALRRAERITGSYAGFRQAFGRPIADYPLVARTLDRIAENRSTALFWVFELVRLWEKAEADGYRGDDAAYFRIVLSLAKAVWTRRATRLLHEAMSLLGGNGIEERFTALPRLYRDSVIMETWEGPHNVLYTQALADMLRFGVDPATFVERVAGEPSAPLVDELAKTLAAARRGEDGTVALADLAPRLLAAPRQ